MSSSLADSTERQQTWAQAQRLTYPILSDANGEARKAYKVSKVALGLIEGQSRSQLAHWAASRGLTAESAPYQAVRRSSSTRMGSFVMSAARAWTGSKILSCLRPAT